MSFENWKKENLTPTLTEPNLLKPSMDGFSKWQQENVSAPIPSETPKIDDETLLRQVEDVDKQLYSATRKRQQAEYGKLSLESIPSPEEQKLTGKKQQIYKDFTQRGYDPNTINFALNVRKKVQAPRYGRMLGAAGAATAVSLATGGAEPSDFFTWPTVYRAVAAGLGGVGGEAAQTGIEEKRLITPKEAGTAFLIEVGTQAGTEGGTVLAKKTIFAPFVKKPTGGLTTDKLTALKKKFAEYGGKFAPTELDERMGVEIAEGVGRGAFGAKSLWQDFEERQGNAARLYADKIISSITKETIQDTPEIVTKDFANAISHGGVVMNKIDDFFDDLYGQIDDLTKSQLVKKTGMVEVPSTILDQSGKPITQTVEKVIGKEFQGATVSTRRLKTWAVEKLAANDALLKTGEEGRNILFSAEGRTALNDILALEDDISFGGMRKFRTRTLNKTLQYARDVNPDKGLMKEIEGIITDSLFDIKNTKGLTPEAMNLLKNTNNLYAETAVIKAKVFREALVDTITANPTKGISQILPDNNPEAIKNMRESLMWPTGRVGARGEGRLIDPEGIIMWNKLRQAKLAEMANKIFTPEGTATRNAVDRTFKQIGDKALKELFPEEELAGNLFTFKQILTRLSEKPPGGNTLLVRSGQGAGAVMLYKGIERGNVVMIGAGGVLILGPVALAKLATTKIGISLLTAGMKPGINNYVPIAARMVNYLVQSDKEEKTKIEVAKRVLERRERPTSTKIYPTRKFNIEGQQTTPSL